MPKKEKINLRDFSTEDLKVKMEQAREALFRLRLSHKSAPLKNPMEIRGTRKMIAKMETLMAEKSSPTTR